MNYLSAVQIVEQIRAAGTDHEAVNSLCEQLEAGGWFLHLTAFRDTTTHTPTGRRMRIPGTAWFNGAVWCKADERATVWYYCNRALSKGYAIDQRFRAAQQAKASADKRSLPLPRAIQMELEKGDK